MNFKKILMTLVAVSALSQSAVISAATVIGTYSMEATATLAGGQGMAYNGTDWYYGSGASWQIHNTAWQSSAAPTDLNDISAASFLAAMPTAGNLSLNFGFGDKDVVNGAGTDLAFFFLWDQSANNANVSINGITRSLSFQNVYNNLNQQQVVNGVNWDGAKQNNVLLMVGAIDLTDFGLLEGAAVSNPFSINMAANDKGNPVALSMIGALHTAPHTTVVPLPAPFVLLFSGLAALGLVSRRK